MSFSVNSRSIVGDMRTSGCHISHFKSPTQNVTDSHLNSKIRQSSVGFTALISGQRDQHQSRRSVLQFSSIKCRHNHRLPTMFATTGKMLENVSTSAGMRTFPPLIAYTRKADATDQRVHELAWCTTQRGYIRTSPRRIQCTRHGARYNIEHECYLHVGREKMSTTLST